MCVCKKNAFFGRTLPVAVCVLCGLVLFTACPEIEAVTDGEEQKNLSVRTCSVQLKEFDDSLESFGTISFKTKNDVTVLVPGQLTEFTVKEGDTVKKGQVIARLKNLQMMVQQKMYESEVESAQARLDLVNSQMQEEILAVESRLLSIEKASLNIKQKELELEAQKKNLENKKKLSKIGGVTKNSIESLEVNLSASRTELEIQKKELEMSTLGLRDEDLINAGMIVSADPGKRKEQLIELNTTTKAKEIESAEAALKAARQQLENANLMMEELVIKSSCDGIIGQNYYENGEYIKENEKLTTVIDISSVYAQIYIQEKEVVKFKKGSRVELEIPSLDIKLKANVSEISPIASAQSGNFLVKIKIPNSSSAIKPGMFVKATLEKSTPKKMLCLPQTALLTCSDKRAVFFALQNSYLVKKEIQFEYEKDGYIWFSQGLDVNEKIVDKPSPFLKEGQVVSIE